MGHLQFSVANRERQAAFYQIERVMSEFLVTPPHQYADFLALPGGERFEFAGLGNQARGDADLTRTDFEE